MKRLKRSTKKVSKAQYVRDCTATSAKEVVRLGARDGVSLTEHYVHSVRSIDRRGKRREKMASPPAIVENPITPAPSLHGKHSADAEQLLRVIASEIGLRRAIDILTTDRAKVIEVLGTLVL